MVRGSGPHVEPVPGSPAATVDLGSQRALLVGDYHAGIEAGLRYERGVELPSNASARRQRLTKLLAQTGADRLVVLGDLSHQIGSSDGVEREELDEFYATVVAEADVPITVTPGNHDSGLSELFADRHGVDILPASGGLLDGANATDTARETSSVGVLHGHTWPGPSLLSADVICMAHEHPTVKLQDSVGGYRVEKAWLRGRLDRGVVAKECGCDPKSLPESDPELIVLPAFNERSGGTWINVAGQGFLAPFLPEALVEADLYLLDGTRLGAYRDV